VISARDRFGKGHEFWGCRLCLELKGSRLVLGRGISKREEEEARPLSSAGLVILITTIYHRHRGVSRANVPPSADRQHSLD
jgi:hypothetical protein